MGYIGNRIKRFRKQKGVSQEKLAEEIGVHRQSIYKWEKGERVPDSTYVQKIAAALGISCSELLDPIPLKKARELSTYSPQGLAGMLGVDVNRYLEWERGESMPPKEVQEKIEELLGEYIAFGPKVSSNLSQIYTENFKNIPLINHYAGAGKPFGIEGIEQEVETYIPLPKELVPFEMSFAFRVQGDSMIPEFKDGDIVVVAPTNVIPSGSIAVVQINGDALMVKQIYFHNNKKEVELRSFNPLYAPVRYPIEEVNIIGKVILKIAKY